MCFFAFAGRLGLGATETKLVPTKVPLESSYSVDDVHCGADCSFILTKQKTVLACGNNKCAFNYIYILKCCFTG